MDPVDIIIRRHAVPSSPETGLSPLQQAMLDDPTPVRIFSAPTGAGKSYAFQMAMLNRNARILFIVPTRRLAQNIAQGLAADLMDAGWSKEDTAERVVTWTSDEREKIQNKHPDLHVGRFRLAQLRMEPGLEAKGLMIVATQESVVHLLLSNMSSKGAVNPQSVYDFLRLDHVVFDEFHTIDTRGFGLACALSAITSRIKRGARITLLSATPVNVRKTLIAFGIAPEHILVDQERVVSGTAEETKGMRAIHGDVSLKIETGTGVLDALARHEDDVRATLARDDAGKQLVIIYDSVKRLLADKAGLAAYFDRLGVSPEERLRINSIDDSVKSGMDDGFTFGSLNDPARFKVLIATSSVEMGVTFKAGMILMEPGHDPCSFVQRIGRVARGDLEGSVVVTATEAQLGRLGWLRKICLSLSSGDHKITVDHFIEQVLSSVQDKFDTSRVDFEDGTGNFRNLPQSAVWSAALFWNAMEHAEWRKAIQSNFENFRPRQADAIGGMLSYLKKSPNRSAKAWASAMIGEAKTLRVIMEKVHLVDPDGVCKSLSWHLYASTPELISAPVTYDEERRIMRVHASRPVSEIETELGGLRAQRYEKAPLPHQQFTVTVPADNLVSGWLKITDKDLRRPGLQMADRKALETARKIVRLTGIVPLDRECETQGGGNAIL